MFLLRRRQHLRLVGNFGDHLLVLAPIDRARFAAGADDTPGAAFAFDEQIDQAEM
ncbi:hypothetical protein D9M72_644480 [compost metagenome]